ncbi:MULTISPECIES: type VI secretion system baseplate subunit TssK [unclassified Roseateles]|uniref:type VI secretion system baseplate subunit TssK n=1 Tax=unclassified Roseateles TaxID=2626991 RepID=UPI0006FD02BE|nr:MULTISPECIES: type VI secretion system baseplate subunit TssK [unclassified Roseateles]KQW49987.1 type VI secretion protein [Pelomonas sp. Root405]KRA67387.1 type VI secretion protein [Pelomonas sp. Root662]
MTWRDRVIWTEGMFLQPQHFQQHDRHWEHQWRQRLQQAVAYGWGFAALSLDEASLTLGKVGLAAAQGLLPDGTAFSAPGSDAAPAALDIPADARNEIVVLAVTLQRPGVVETDAEGAAGSMGPRFTASEVNVGDSNSQLDRDAALQVGRLNLRLMLQRDAGEGYATLGVARVVERRADNRVVLDPAFVPPLLHAPAHPVLDGYVRELCGLLNQRGEALAARLAAPGRGGVGEIADFLLLEAVNRNQALFNHLRSVSLLHPERLYTDCLTLAGDLATFRDSRRPAAYAEYVHDDLAATFRPVIDDLRQSLSMVMEQTAIPIELQDRAYGVRVALIPDVQLQRSATFVLAVSAQLPGDALRARFPTQVKIGPVERIRDLVNLQLPGVTLRPLPVAPRQIPYHAGHNYFELETRGNELWKQLESSGGLAMHIAGEFPGLELEFWAIRA